MSRVSRMFRREDKNVKLIFDEIIDNIEFFPTMANRLDAEDLGIDDTIIISVTKTNQQFNIGLWDKKKNFSKKDLDLICIKVLTKLQKKNSCYLKKLYISQTPINSSLTVLSIIVN
jgi:hypothetical protein